MAVVFAVSLLAGCSPEWKKKFVRKRNAKEGPAAILVLQPDHLALHPPADRYREHFAFWKSWHSGLLESYGKLKKRDTANLTGAIGELRSMQALLTGKPAERLKEILTEMDAMEDRWNAAPTPAHPPADRSFLQKVQREVNKDFHYSNIKETVAP